MAKVTAAVVESEGAGFALQELDLGDPRSDEVVVKIEAAGICHTDLTVRDGGLPTPLPAVLGHEGAGLVERVGDGVKGLAEGDRVSLSFDYCGSCPNCQAGKPFYCHEFGPRNFGASRPDETTALSRNGESLHSHFFGQSAFATRAVVPRNSVTKVPGDIPFSVLAPFGCGIQTGAGAVLNVMRPQPGDALVVSGLGGVGMSAVMAAKVTGCQTIIGVDPNPDRLELSQELGATHGIDPGKEDVVEEVMKVTGRGAQFSLEMSGNIGALQQAVYCLAPAGVCGVVGAPPGGTEVSLDVNDILSVGRTVRGIVEGESIPRTFIPQLVSLWEKGLFPVDRLIETFDFDQINEAAEKAQKGEVVKPVLTL
ncbi:MAG: NAD(P)-dependent alcohol dehydrogenase [Solirubrobacterales bacterium]